MAIDLEKDCPCVKDCPRHGNCVACHDHHKTMERPSTCKRAEIQVSADHKARVVARLKAAGRIV